MGDATLIAALLVGALVGGGQPVDRARAVQLRAAAVERMARLDDDSALVLYRAARAADPGYLLAQYEYIEMMLLRFRAPELRREFATMDTASALGGCLIAASHMSANAGAPTLRLKAIEARFGPTPCTDAMLLGIDGMASPARIKRAMRDSPELMIAWSAAAREAMAAQQLDVADRALRAGMRASTDPLRRLAFTMARATQFMVRHDTARARLIWREAGEEARRDGRPGVMATYLANRCSGLHFVPDGTAETRAADCRTFATIVRPRRAHYLEWETMRGLGKTLMERGEVAAALPFLDRAVQLADSFGSPGLRLISHTLRGRAHSKVAEIAPALDDLRLAIEIGRSAEEPYFLAEAWHNLGHAFETGLRMKEALAAMDTFATIVAPMSGNSQRWISRHDAGTIRWKLGMHAAATRDFDAMVRYVDAQGDGYFFAGEYYERMGNLGAALRYYRTGARSVSLDPRNLTALARVYGMLGFPDSAESVARLHDRDPSQWPILEQPLLPAVLARHGQVGRAVLIAAQWSRHQQASGNVQGAVIARLRLAELLLMNRQPEDARREATVADSVSVALGFTAEATEARTLAGRALFASGQREAGLTVLRDATRRAARHPTVEGLRASNLALASALETEHRGAEALAAYDRAARAVETMSAGLDQDVDRAGFKSQHLAPFDGALRLLFRGNGSDSSAQQALTWSARRKASALALAGAPAGATLRPLSIAALRNALASDEALIDFTVIDSGITAIVARRTSVARLPLPASVPRLEAWMEAIRRPLVATPGGSIDLAHARFDVTAAESLYRALIAPLEPALGGVKRLTLVPDGALWYVPFAALVDKARSSSRSGPSYLLERYELRLLPSAQFLVAMQPGSGLRDGFRVEALSYSVPGGDAELSAITSALGPARVRARDGARATEGAALGAKADVLHLAVHGIVDDRDPLASHLMLAPEKSGDGLLHLSEVSAHRLSARLVVLTACEAVSGKLYAGEGLVGLARAFLVSGAKQVVASQWPVDASAALLMRVFYGELTAGRSAPAALRSAQLALLKDSSTAHPIHWAGFVAFGGVSNGH